MNKQTQSLSEKIEEIIKRLKAIKPENNEQYNKIALQLLLIEEIIDIQKQAIQKTLKELKEKIENHRCAFDISGTNGRITDTYTWVERKLINEFIDTTFKQNFGGLAQ